MVCALARIPYRVRATSQRVSLLTVSFCEKSRTKKKTVTSSFGRCCEFGYFGGFGWPGHIVFILLYTFRASFRGVASHRTPSHRPRSILAQRAFAQVNPPTNFCDVPPLVLVCYSFGFVSFCSVRSVVGWPKSATQRDAVKPI